MIYAVKSPGKYIAFYKLDGDEVHIIRVLYGRRNYIQTLFDLFRD